MSDKTPADIPIAWTREALEALGPTTDVPTAASVFGCSEWTLYEQIRQGRYALTRVLRLGRRLLIPTNDLITLLYGAGPATNPATVTVPEDITTDESNSLRAVRPRN